MVGKDYSDKLPDGSDKRMTTVDSPPDGSNKREGTVVSSSRMEKVQKKTQDRVRSLYSLFLNLYRVAGHNLTLSVEANQ